MAIDIAVLVVCGYSLLHGPLNSGKDQCKALANDMNSSFHSLERRLLLMD
jgi:hypothetical protein